MHVITAALKIGIILANAMLAGTRRKMCDADTTIIPMTINTDASPRLNAVMSASP